MRRLSSKLFISYLVVIVVGLVTLAVAAEWQTPAAVNRHMSQMPMMMGATGMMDDLTDNITRTLHEILLVAAVLSVVAASVVSSFVARRIVRPVQALQAASRRMADGSYEERVPATGADELGELGRAFNRMADELARTEERRRQLIGDVAHELRTPLSSIQSVMEGLQDGVLPPVPQTFASVEQEVNRLQRLVRDLEDLSRAEAGQVPLEKKPTRPLDLATAAAERLGPQFADKQVALTVTVSADLPSILVDPARLTQVLLNLLGNALQYTPSGGHVSVQGAVSDGRSAPCQALGSRRCLLLSVTDSGIGLTPEQIGHIFERFYRVDKSRSRVGGGSGIGLTISQHWVEAHGGRLSAASPGLNQGSTFTIALPLVD